MPAFIKTPEDERLWVRAQELAKEQGKAENWAYVTSIYKSLNGGKVACMDPTETLAIRYLLAEDAKIGVAYPGNLGAVEMVRFYQIASHREQSLMDRLLDSNKYKAAWMLLKKVTGVKLVDPEWRTAKGQLPSGGKKAPIISCFTVATRPSITGGTHIEAMDPDAEKYNALASNFGLRAVQHTHIGDQIFRTADVSDPAKYHQQISVAHLHFDAARKLQDARKKVLDVSWLLRGVKIKGDQARRMAQMQALVKAAEKLSLQAETASAKLGLPSVGKEFA